jgi:glycosyltransferase involved in cell wall biosynthesis
MSGGGSAPRFSIVLPVYNESGNLAPLFAEIREAMDPLPGGYEVIFVDDGSTDDGPREMKALAAEEPRVRVVRLRRNSGQTAAMDAGFRAAAGEVVVTLDADGQNPPSDIPRLVEALEGGAAAAVGFRKRRADTAWKRLQSRIANGVRDRLSGDRVRDTGCSLKAYRADWLARVKLYEGMHRFLPTLLRLEGAEVVEVPVGHRPRAGGASKYGMWNRVFRSFVDLLAVRWMRKRWLDYEVER